MGFLAIVKYFGLRELHLSLSTIDFLCDSCFAKVLKIVGERCQLMHVAAFCVLRIWVMLYTKRKDMFPLGGTRTPNLRFRRPTPYPLGHAGTPAQNSCNTPRQLTSPADGGKNNIFVRRPGIEPGSQEWESCMIPLHQRRIDIVQSTLSLIMSLF